MDDYPREALRKNQQGDVQVKVGVSADGHPTGCTVIHSSGYPALDAQTCKVIMARAGFSPALDAAGHPVPSTFTAPMIHWRIQ